MTATVYRANGRDELTASTELYRRNGLVVRAVSFRAEIPEKQWTKELFPLLAEGPFRFVSQQCLVALENYKEVT